MTTFLKYQHSTARSLFFPVFTKNQAIYLALFIGIAFLFLVLVDSDLRLISIVFYAAAIGSLSQSAPALLIMDRTKSDCVETLLKAQGRTYDSSKALWLRPGSKMTLWENDEVSIINDQTVMIVLGPYHTLRALRKCGD